MMYTPRLTLVEADLSNAQELLERSVDILTRPTHSDPRGTVVPPCLIIFVESVSNPSGRVFAFEGIKELRTYTAKHRIPPTKWTTIIDNTWTSCVSLNPFDYGIDCVCVSLTKYYSGGNVIGGAILTKVPYKSKYITMIHKSNGYHMSPHDTHIILREISGTKMRLERASMVAMEVMLGLTQRGLTIINPLIPGHETHIRATQVLKYVPPIFTVFVKLQDKERIFGVFRQFAPNIQIRTSYGGKDSRLCNYPRKVGDAMRLRIAIGYENQNVGELIEMLYRVITECDK